jgi:folate-binding protein YgfZ
MNVSDSTKLSLIQVSGPDAAKFLQGQLTCDVYTLTTEHSYQIGAHCDPKGRIQATFRLFKQQADFYFLLPANMAATLLTCLQKYAIFSKVTLTQVTDSEHLPHFQSLLWPSHNITNWELLDIRAGIATIFPETSGQFTPHQLNYQLINGVSFNKGCYTGQEIVARMHYLGKLKQQTYRIRFTHENLLSPGTLIYNQQAQPIGTLLTLAAVRDHTTTHTLIEKQNSYEALAVLQNNALQENMYLSTANDNILTLLDLPYQL